MEPQYKQVLVSLMIGAKATQRGAVRAVLHLGTKILLSVEKYMSIHFQGKMSAIFQWKGKTLTASGIRNKSCVNCLAADFRRRK